MTDLREKYRPATLDDVVGQPAAVRSLKTAVKKNHGRAFLFTGPSGTGKTTLARIVARDFGCTDRNIREVDAATFTGIDDWRAVREHLRYSPLEGSRNRAVVVDEAHALSKAAWQSLLKDVEEPPPNVYWFILTTDRSKVPDTIVTRCLSYELRSVPKDDLFDLLTKVCKAEGGGPPKAILDLIAEGSNGSPRQALSHLMALWDATKEVTARKHLATVGEDAEVIALARALMQGAQWGDLMGIVRGLEASGQSPEGVRRVVIAYFTKVALGGKSGEKVLAIMDAFSTPYPTGDNSMSHVILSLGRLVFQ